MRAGGWSYEIRARCTVGSAVALLSDITRQGELHPLITKVVELPPEPGALRSFAITDRLALGPVRFRITYFADTVLVTDDEVVTVARQRPRTTVRSHVRLTQEPDGIVAIRVDVSLEAPTLLFGFALREGRAAHLILAERIRTVLEASPG